MFSFYVKERNLMDYFSVFIEGGHIDGPENGPAPGPWDIPTQCEELFKDEKKSTLVRLQISRRLPIYSSDGIRYFYLRVRGVLNIRSAEFSLEIYLVAVSVYYRVL
jgi:hypothetical protein